MGYELWVMSLWVMGYGLWVVGCGVVGWRLWGCFGNRRSEVGLRTPDLGPQTTGNK
jgi:hypothetical protein